MITRLKVSGFKNLLDLDVRFGPFTCIFGANGAGKSNLFDAIHFLSLLAHQDLAVAARTVRADGNRSRDGLELFYRNGNYVSPRIDFEVELLVPRHAVDLFGRKIEAKTTALRYVLSIGRNSEDQLIILDERLTGIPLTQAREQMVGFPSSADWRESVIQGEWQQPYFIAMDSNLVKVYLEPPYHEPMSYETDGLTRTALNASGLTGNPTLLVLRQEMQSWLALQLEPSSLRRSDEIFAPSHMTASGEHLPATIKRLTGIDNDLKVSLANRIAELVGEVRDVYAEQDTARRLITAYAAFVDGTVHPASSLSDGTLRFLALAVLEQDPEFRGLLCMEEPENGIHPERIPAMLRLLTDIATDADFSSGPANPLRQVIINTHSSACAAEVLEDSLLSFEPAFTEREGIQLPTVKLTALADTWRTLGGEAGLDKGKLIGFLKPIRNNGAGRGRVVDRHEVQAELQFADEP
jgi:predicted ATPase